MEIKTIISSICLLLLAVSCSMDDDALRDIEKGHSGSVVIEEGEVALSMKVSLFSLETKSLSGAGTLPASMDEAKIDNCTLIFFEGGQVNSIMEGLFVNSENYIVKKKNGTEDDWAKVIVKVKKPSPYSVMVIANSSKSFAGCQSESDINDIIQDNKDALVKVGKMNINFDSNFAGYATIREALEKPLEVGPVPLSQLTARIELAEFNVSGFQGASVQEKITVTGVDLLNLNPESYTTNEQTHKNATYLQENKTCNEEVYDGVSELPSTYSFVENKNVLSFYSFRNLAAAESDQVKIQVRFKVGNSEERTTRQFVINKEGNILHGVKSGYVYRLVVNMTIIGDKVETELLCYTRDWLNNTISIPMEDN